MLTNEKNSLTLSVLKKMREQGAPTTVPLTGMAQGEEDTDTDTDTEDDEEPDQSGTVTAGSNAMIKKARKKLDSK